MTGKSDIPWRPLPRDARDQGAQPGPVAGCARRIGSCRWIAGRRSR
ncbi:hypothetical protein Salmuc_01991 [Salipiger mucosus DSM 16094]|uniref:Uncharacterized protein n=1 Tax=Salipiger mucosus DSM 16094 TaxID=1123237 RepID=S9Q875_9RHOB|nr:hypothetical protein Salmuc_01991 [Salipiger mucosus DSM 16094]